MFRSRLAISVCLLAAFALLTQELWRPVATFSILGYDPITGEIGGAVQSRVVLCRVVFRVLDARRIEAYLRREQPYDCAGSAKAEGLGIALIARMETEDPTSLIGLPLIALTEMLERAGMPVLG